MLCSVFTKIYPNIIKATIMNYYDDEVQRAANQLRVRARKDIQNYFAICLYVVVSDKARRDAGIHSNIAYDIIPGQYLFTADSYDDYRNKVQDYLSGEPESEYEFVTVFNRDYTDSDYCFSITPGILADIESYLDGLGDANISVKFRADRNTLTTDNIWLCPTDVNTKNEQMLWICIDSSDRASINRSVKDGGRWVVIYLGQNTSDTDLNKYMNKIYAWIRRYSASAE